MSSFVTTYAAGALLDVALWAPLVVAAVLLAAGSAAMMALPEPAGKGRGNCVWAHIYMLCGAAVSCWRRAVQR